jgi:hypothetical protein
MCHLLLPILSCDFTQNASFYGFTSYVKSENSIINKCSDYCRKTIAIRSSMGKRILTQSN